MLKKIFFSIVALSAMAMAESTYGINVNNNDVELEAIVDSKTYTNLQTGSTSYVADANYIYDKDNENSLIGIGAGATNKIEGLEGVNLTVGAKVMVSSLHNEDFVAVPFMGKIDYKMPPLLYNIPPVSLEGKVLYAPNVLSFGDAESYTEMRAVANMEVINNVKGYVGYRNIETSYKNAGDVLFDNSFFAGVKIDY
jgi:hypothetical protein